MATFVTVPIATAYLAFSWPIARSIAFGQLRSAVYLLAPSIAALALAVVGETWFILATYACYARGEVRIPLQSMVVRVGITVVLMMVAMLAHGPVVLVLLGLSLSFGSLAGASRIGWKLRPVLPQFGSSLMRPVARIGSLSAVAMIPVVPTLVYLDHITRSRLLQTGELAAALVCFFGLYLVLQTWVGAPEIESLRSTPLFRRGRRLGVPG
jgi:peptidoglycan biosynthesis protein MviN/MurJ (putative lipid II flippase)